MPRRKLVEHKATIDVHPYGACLTVIFTNSVYGSIKKFNVEDPEGYKEADGAVVYDLHPTMILQYEPTLNTMVHEVSHASEIILEKRGIEPKGEQRAYLEGFLAEKVAELQAEASKYFK